MPAKNGVRNGLIRSARNALRQGAKLFELAVFPSFCKICGTLLENPGERVLCAGCLAKIVPETASACVCCGRFFDGEGGPHPCAACLDQHPPYGRHRSCARYKGQLKDALLLFKYRRYRSLGKELGRFVVAAAGDEVALWEGVDVIVPVPLHRRRRHERGFDQARVLAREIGRLRRLSVAAGLLRKVRNIAPQTSLERDERKANVRGAYEAPRPDRIKGRVVLLVDDVFTTGSTIGECASVLKRAGAKDVRAVTVAQA
jgi:competence protein ComFC